MKLFVDDIRDAPEGWVLARTISETINIIETLGEDITHISLDHDISIPVKVGDVYRPYPSTDTFKVVASFFGLFWYHNYHLDREIEATTHSSNPQGRRDIVNILKSYGIDCKETPFPIAKRQ